MRHLLLALFLLAPGAVFAQSEPVPPDWGSLTFLIGSWEGKGTGCFGDSTVTIDYEAVLDSYFLQGRLHSVYPPQTKNPKGEIHRNWDLYGLDRDRNRWVMRQFHDEGFVITYVHDPAASTDKTIVFVSEHIDNIATLIGKGWRARQTIRVVSRDEYHEVFELAGPDEPFATAVETRFRRKAR